MCGNRGGHERTAQMSPKLPGSPLSLSLLKLSKTPLSTKRLQARVGLNSRSGISIDVRYLSFLEIFFLHLKKKEERINDSPNRVLPVWEHGRELTQLRQRRTRSKKKEQEKMTQENKKQQKRGKDISLWIACCLRVAHKK